MPFILQIFLSVMNFSFPLSILLLSIQVSGSPVSPHNFFASVFIIFPEDSCSSFYCLLLFCISLPPTTFSICKRFGIALHMLMYTWDFIWLLHWATQICSRSNSFKIYWSYICCLQQQQQKKKKKKHQNSSRGNTKERFLHLLNISLKDFKFIHGTFLEITEIMLPQLQVFYC